MDKDKQARFAVFSIIVLIIINVLVFFIGNKIDLFTILCWSDAEKRYYINYGNLVCLMGIVGYNVLTIYHIALKAAVRSIVDIFDTDGSLHHKVVSVKEDLASIETNVHSDVVSVKDDVTNAEKNVLSDVANISDGLRKVEAHLINYDSDSIEFKHLSAIESEVGITKQEIHNEIWILTNDFEECNDTEEGIELRTAIVNNLINNVDYYYIIPKSCIKEMRELIKKLNLELKNIKHGIKGSLSYITDDALDFIPTPYFDIIMYLKTGKTEGYVEDPSSVYYCFSRKEDGRLDKKYYYQKVSEASIMDKMKNRTQKYKKEARFTTAIPAATK